MQGAVRPIPVLCGAGAEQFAASLPDYHRHRPAGHGQVTPRAASVVT